MQKSRSQYESFLFWRQPIAELDLTQLEGLMDGPPANSIKGKDTLSSARSEEGEMTEFSSCNYWRAPIVDVDALMADLNLLL
ncbi:protein AF1q isoform X3 [Pseudoliparis swirei]|nr:protein AF1q isoform X3 [Pseudoliparis swirei]